MGDGKENKNGDWRFNQTRGKEWAQCEDTLTAHHRIKVTGRQATGVYFRRNFFSSESGRGMPGYQPMGILRKLATVDKGPAPHRVASKYQRAS